jgi:tetratricopeptide (TPR) repeat protein
MNYQRRGADRRTRAIALGFLMLLASPSPATEAPIAETLFDEGRSLLEQGNVEEALAKFKESQRLDPSPGTLLNIALSYERLGRTASAWAAYREAERLALQRGRAEVAAEARNKSTQLQATLSYLTLRASAPPEGFRVVHDEVEIHTAALGVPFPTDPGLHTVRASAPGYRAWEGTVDMKPNTKTVLVIPSLAPLEKVVIRDNRAPSPWAWATLGTGAGILGTAAVFGVLAKVQHDNAWSNCSPACNSLAYQYEGDAGTLADTSTVLFPIGAAVVLGGVAWFVWGAPAGDASPQTSQTKQALRVSTGNGLSLQYEGSF